MVIVEYCPLGSVKQFLRNQRKNFIDETVASSTENDPEIIASSSYNSSMSSHVSYMPGEIMSFHEFKSLPNISQEIDLNSFSLHRIY